MIEPMRHDNGQSMESDAQHIDPLQRCGAFQVIR